MTGPMNPPVFDGHNDLVLRLITGKVTAPEVHGGCDSGHIDLPRARAGGFGGGMFAIFVPSPAEQGMSFDDFLKPEYDMPLPDQLGQAHALDMTLKGCAALEVLEEAGVIELCTDTARIEAVMTAGEKMAAVMHIEGAEGIDDEFLMLEAFHRRGLRSLGPVWSRPTQFGHGVPFRYPAGPDTGPGLTDLGRALIRECNRLNIMVDLSHLNEKGFDDVAAISDAPLVATHSNAWEICPHARNLTDRQLAMIAETDGMVGINFAAGFLRPDGQMDGATGLDVMMRHLDHLISVLGEDRVGFGSDFDGAIVPQEIGDVAGLPNLRAAMTAHGVDAVLMEKLCWRNWMRVLDKTWNG